MRIGGGIAAQPSYDRLAAELEPQTAMPAAERSWGQVALRTRR